MFLGRGDFRAIVHRRRKSACNISWSLGSGRLCFLRGVRFAMVVYINRSFFSARMFVLWAVVLASSPLMQYISCDCIGDHGL
ncbi:hypothetical protein BO82DRAFT_126021 [Aspergillus uvarum CBS 121591]|uniref:Uncharacterized protein n=1 Tax=Aspergillus uvarum CBS 121591 TaxID=1448315 RepID=A0A319C794_9EURO|nr:hypothetical protein BO82DRAFT_126021 [Aspergillus uvarum CBS 121591]PYH79699.1 hypothetical protein BO82DRAFT_126021 [Aspergillus uvarum CBS 121591]